MNSPERMNVAVSELDDYPPRIRMNLLPTGTTCPPVEFKVAGLKKERSFLIANECMARLA